MNTILSKTTLIVTLFVISIGLYSCSENSTEIEQPNSGFGKMMLEIDKTSAPDNVAFITATLTRTGYSDITGSMSLLSDSTAEITFNNINAGPWHLVVEAFDSDSLLRYRGETDVAIIENYLTNVNLVLSPVTGSGLGSIRISVIWGASTDGWASYSGNPVITASQLPYSLVGIQTRSVLFKDGKYRIWYRNIQPSAVGTIGYAESADGFNWNYISQTPVLTPSPGSWDSYTIGSPVVVMQGNQFRMYYSGSTTAGEYSNIGTATSTDGINWIKHPDPVLYSTSAEQSIVASDIVLHNDTFYLYYYLSSYFDPSAQSGVFLAKSSDGINFVRNSNNPILTADYTWEAPGIRHPSVVYRDNEFRMVYTNENSDALGLAVSSDGENFIKTSNQPFFVEEMITGTWTEGLYYPYFFSNENLEIIYVTDVSDQNLSAVYRNF